MDQSEAKALAKSMLKTYLEEQGINTKKLFRCLSSEHADTHASMGYDERTNTCRCFACGEHGDIFDVIRMQYGISKRDYKKIFETTYRILGIHVNGKKEDTRPIFQPPPKAQPIEVKREYDFKDYFKEASNRLVATDYYKQRGISEEVAKRFHLGYDPEWVNPALDETTKKNIHPSPRLIIPTSPHSYLARDTRIHLQENQKRYAKIKVGQVHIFNADAIQNTKEPIFLVEGEIDAMSIIVAGGAACALGSTSNCGIFLEECRKNPPQKPIIICADNDTWGKKAMAHLTAGLMSMGIQFLLAEISGKYKDANERLISDPEGLRVAVINSINRAKEMQDRIMNGMTPNELVDSMYKKLREKGKNKALPEEFWTDVFSILNQTISEIQQARAGIRVLRVMAAGVTTMATQLGGKVPEEAVEIKKIAEDALKKEDRNDLGWEKILDLAETIQNLAEKIILSIQNKNNPLLAIPEIRSAPPLQCEATLKNLSSKELYVRTIKKIALDNNTYGIYEADIMAAKLLHKIGLSDGTIQECLIHSPRLSHLSARDKNFEVKAFLNRENNLKKGIEYTITAHQQSL